VVSLSDRLTYLVDAKSGRLLDELFGIRTVDDLLRHYPRGYTEGATQRGTGEQAPDEGQHITLVDTITDTESFPM